MGLWPANWELPHSQRETHSSPPPRTVSQSLWSLVQPPKMGLTWSSVLASCTTDHLPGSASAAFYCPAYPGCVCSSEMALALGKWGVSLRLPCLLAWGSGFLLSLLLLSSLSEGLPCIRLCAGDVSNVLIEIRD